MKLELLCAACDGGFLCWEYEPTDRCAHYVCARCGNRVVLVCNPFRPYIRGISVDGDLSDAEEPSVTLAPQEPRREGLKM